MSHPLSGLFVFQLLENPNSRCLNFQGLMKYNARRKSIVKCFSLESSAQGIHPWRWLVHFLMECMEYSRGQPLSFLCTCHSFCKGDPYPKVCAQRTMGVEDFLCCGLRQGPRPVSYMSFFVATYISLRDKWRLSRIKQTDKQPWLHVIGFTIHIPRGLHFS